MSIKDLFPGYLGYSDEELIKIWNESIIFFDANALLNLFEYSRETYREFVDVMSNPVFLSRFYITYQVAEEFSRNRIKRIDKQLSAPESITKKLEEINRAFIDWIRASHKFHSLIDVDALVADVDKFIISKISEISKIDTKDIRLHHEEVEKFVIDIIGNNITEKPGQERLSQINELAKQRYPSEIPPGFKDKADKSDDARANGDLILWLEMIRFVSDKTEKSVIFITDDKKEDWWLKKNGKTIGPHPLLIQEMLENSITYYQYTSEQFLKYASAKTGSAVSEATLIEVKEVASKTNNLDHIIEKIKYSPMMTIRRIEAIEEMKIDKSLSLEKYYSEIIREIDEFIENHAPTSKVFESRHLNTLLGYRREDPIKMLSNYMSNQPMPRPLLLKSIINEIRTEAAMARSRSLNSLRTRAILKKRS